MPTPVTYLSDDFSAPLVTGTGGNWAAAAGFDGVFPDTSGGVLRLPQVQYLQSSSITSYAEHPFKCTNWEWEIGNVPLSGIYALDFYRAALAAVSSDNVFSWRLRYDPPTLGPPETAGTDVVVMLYPTASVSFPPVSDDQAGTAVPFDPVAHRFLRIREECRGVIFQTSPDEVTWTTAFTYTLDAGFVYSSFYSLQMNTRAGYTFDQNLFTLDVTAVSIIGTDDCLCPEGGWHVGQAGFGGAW